MASTLAVIAPASVPQRRSKVLSLILAAVAVFVFCCELALPQQQAYNNVICACDSGAKKMKVFGLVHKQRVPGRFHSVLKPGDMVKVSTKTQPGKKKVFTAIIVATPQPRGSLPSKMGTAGMMTGTAGIWMAVDQPRAILCDTAGNPVGKSIKGAVDPLAIMRWPKIGEMRRRT